MLREAERRGSTSPFRSVSDGIAHDVGRMHVRKLVHDLASSASCSHQARATQNTQVLTDEGLRRPDRIDQFVDAVGVIGQQVDDGEANGSR